MSLTKQSAINHVIFMMTRPDNDLALTHSDLELVTAKEATDHGIPVVYVDMAYYPRHAGRYVAHWVVWEQADGSLYGEW